MLSKSDIQPDLAFTVVVPVYNSVETLLPLFEQVKAVFTQNGYLFEVVFVDDHSRMPTWERLLEIKKQYPEQVRLIRLTKNFGQNSATLCGIGHARYGYIITLDDDLEVPPAEIARLIECQLSRQADVVYGQTDRQKVSWLRRLGSRGIRGFFSSVEGGAKVGSSFRLITPWIADNLRQHSHDHLFINQVISWYTSDARSVPIQPAPRQEGRSGYSVAQLFSIAFRLIFYYSSFPLRALIFLGISIALACFGIGAYYIWRKLYIGAMDGYTSMIVAIFFTTGIILASISVLGIYVKRIYDARVKKPNYLVKIKL